MLKDFINLINENNINVYGIVVMQNGQKVAEHHFAPEERRNLYSISKSITSTAVGMAIEEGYFCLEDSIIKFFEEDIPKELPKEHIEQLAKITVERLLTMSIVDYPFERLACDNWLQHILAIPLPNIDRINFQYSNFTSYLAGVIVEKTTKMSMMDYLKPRLFDPLDILEVTCAYSPEGYFYGSTGIKLTINELARFGQLYLQKGNYRGTQLISVDWVEKATMKQIENREGGYGYYFWRYQDNTYRATGKWGQICSVIPDKKAVIAVMSNLEDKEQASMMKECLWNTVYPKL